MGAMFVVSFFRAFFQACLRRALTTGRSVALRLLGRTVGVSCLSAGLGRDQRARRRVRLSLLGLAVLGEASGRGCACMRAGESSSVSWT